MFFFRLDPNISTMPVHNILTHRQANPRSWVLRPAMQPLKYLKNAFVIFGGDANPIILNADRPSTLFLHHINRDLGWWVAVKYDRISNRVFVKLDHLNYIGKHAWQNPTGNIARALCPCWANCAALLSQESNFCRFDTSELIYRGI